MRTPAEDRLAEERLVQFFAEDEPYRSSYRAPASKPVEKKIAVTGCPRSGTVYLARLLNELGLRVGHEKMGTDGIVSAFYAVDALTEDLELSAEPPQDYHFQCWVHLVRHPLACIESMAREIPYAFWRWQEHHTGIEVMPEPGVPPRATALAAFWIEWNRRAANRSQLCIRLEDVAKIRPVAHPGTHPKEPIDWRAFGYLAGPLAVEAMSYGYTLR